MTDTPSVSPRAVIVTGASRGIGRAIALAFAERGDNVCMAARDAAALEGVAAEATAAGAAGVLPLAADLRDPAEPARVVAAVREKFGRLDGLVNNAGATKRGDFLTLSDEDYADGFALKFHGAVRMCRAAWPALMETNGAIVNIAGASAHTPTPDFTIGGPVNSAVVNFSKALANRGIEDGVRVNCVCPGHVRTERLDQRVRVRAERDGLDLDAAREVLRCEYGISRFGESREIAAVIAFLLSPEAAYIQGAVIDVDGGTRRGI